MCGIAGIVAEPLSSQHREVLRHMTNSIGHRGPDGQGRRLFRSCGLGHRRLAIVDLFAGAQPMSSPDDSVGITFNGEIYGYKDVRKALPDYPFKTQSDTEVILALYNRYGRDTAKHLPGMFAFAIWDDSRRELFCARDRFGEKPFYFATGRGGEFLFASEIKAILASGLVDTVVNKAAIARYLKRQCVRADQSIYENIHSLPPGHTLLYREGRIQIARYWEMPDIDRDISISDATESFQSLLQASVRRQLIADVPVGAFLSGGLDSSTISLLAREMAGDLRTFSFDFEGDHSETDYARAVAQAYQTQHIELSAQGEDIATHLLRMQRVFDEPMGDTSAIPTYLLAREARQHIKVALTGDGGDELCGGYLWYKPLLWMEREGRVSFLRWVAARVLNRLSQAAHIPGAAGRELRITGMGLGQQYESLLSAHRAQLSFFDSQELKRLGLNDEATGTSPEGGAISGTMDDVIRMDISDYMPANNLTRIDRASMAHGLELRAPFLDVDFATFCISLPYRLKVSTSDDKIILRQAFSTRWPPLIRNRSKQGFGAPLERWLKDPGIRALEEQYLFKRSAPIYDIVPAPALLDMLGRMNPIQRWTVLVLAVWLAEKNHRFDADHISIGNEQAHPNGMRAMT